jgi:predicted P-loop ATPase
LRADKDQLWAEAVVGFKAGMSWGLTDSKAIKEAEREQEAQRVAGVWEGPVAKFIEGKESVIIEDILSNVLHIDLAKQGQIEQNRVSRCLKALDWQRGWLHDKRCNRRRRVGRLLHAGGKGARHQSADQMRVSTKVHS